MIQIDLSSNVPVYRQIVEEVRLQVAQGDLKPGDRLEPVRQLADRLSVNASTVARAYQALERDGIIQTNRRGGSVIAREQTAEQQRPVRESRLRNIVERALVEALAHGYHADEVEAAFALQLAAWRERRSGPPVQRRPLSETQRLLRFAGSHDLAMELLLSLTRRVNAAASFTASYIGSLDGLLALLHDEAVLAGAHILDEETGEYNVPILRRLFPAGGLCLVTLAERMQGLIVARGNPSHISAMGDLARPEVRFVNRQPGSGTRTLLDYQLRLAGLSPEAVNGYRSIVTTHLEAAAAVAEGRADVGMGVFAAARAYGLDFIPITRERYDLVFYAPDRQAPSVAAVLDTMRLPAFRSVVGELGGYDTAHTGEEIPL